MGFIRRILADRAGSVAIYSGMLAVLGIGAAALAIDYGRLAVVRAQMQDRADAGAMAAAVFLDKSDGARAAAEDVARNSVQQFSAIAGDAELRVGSVSFYSAVTPSRVPATGDQDAMFIEVVLEPKTVNFFFQPLLSMVAGGTSPNSEQLDAMAMAAADPFICDAPPLMMCDPAESDPTLSLTDPNNIGRQFRLKEPQAGGGAMVPGNFGLLRLPDGSGGAAAIGAALAAVTAPDCYTMDVTTAPGSKTVQVKNGMNARFDITGAPDPAPNVINYPRDTIIENDPSLSVGDGVWDIADYWDERHGGGLPTGLDDASRYQTYLYELGLDYARNGKKTLYPAPDTLPDGYALIEPGGVDLPVDEDDPNNPDVDGVPSQAPASNGPARRIVKVTVLQCIAENVKGSATYPTNGQYVEMFVTETVQDPPEAAIYAELRGSLTPATSPDFHANVQLVQ